MRRGIAKLKPFFNYTLVNLVSKVLISLIVLCFPILFNSEDYGEFVLAYSFFQLIVVFVTAGHYEQIIPVKDPYIRKNKMKTSLFSILVIMIGIFCLFKITSNGIFDDYIILTICFSGVFLGYNLLFVKYLFLEKKEHIATRFSFLFSLVFYLPAFIFTYFYRNWNNFFLISSIIGLISTLIIAKIYLTKSRISFKEFLTFQKKAIPYLIIAFIGWFGGYGYNYLVDNEFSIEIVGAFGFVLSISNFILVISNSINLVWSSRLFNNFKFDSSQNKSDLKLWGGLTILIMIITIAIDLVFPVFVNLFYKGNTYFLDLGKYIPLIGVAYCIYVPTWQAKNFYYFHNYSVSLLKMTFYSGLFGILGAFMLIKMLGLLGLFLGFIFNYLSQTIIITNFSIKKWNYKVPYSLVAICSLILIAYFLIVSF